MIQCKPKLLMFLASADKQLPFHMEWLVGKFLVCVVRGCESQAEVCAWHMSARSEG